ncbi:transcriptional coactivator/pterin dehydratase [Lophium mytilinum]|uniref:4a-hydroxytetrahydrobiopterin dehydratase n=1 Tax=Lophium mytilinum TaxID=390894 RepID=A0A6A6R7E4_9PEZI|nr:transcriptional coactivator/pterin dehydratase [Lophium mytilinum]
MTSADPTLSPSASITPIFSPSQPADLPARATSLLRTSSWTLTPSRIAITRVYRFKTFKAAWAFMNKVADECKRQRHHPSWHNLYNEVTIEWTTHRPEGLSIKDVEMAEFCDRVAEEGGAVEGEEGKKCC